ncbi:hypothetical protein Taro_051698 [Colocasia esculenta]|uniref:Secreted protein n=1 Tax=Colocasia esculenta TaxID=4460 RepID=A0A843XHI8_COLES|nr:hypothetical protein [Colocasia esculenta]
MIYTSFPLSSLTYLLANLHVAHTFPLTLGTNIVNVTVELSSFGRPKEENLKPHLLPLREAATTTWSKHSLGHSQPSQPGSQRGQSATHHRQRETSNVREPPEDTHSRHGNTAAAKRIVHKGQYTESAFHNDRKSCLTRLEISTHGRTYGCTNIANIVSPFGLFPPLHRRNWA